MDGRTFDLLYRGQHSPRVHDESIDQFAVENVHSVEIAVGCQPAGSAHELTGARLQQRRPGIAVDEDAPREKAVSVAAGCPL